MFSYIFVFLSAANCVIPACFSQHPQCTCVEKKKKRIRYFTIGIVNLSLETMYHRMVLKTVSIFVDMI